MNNPIVKALILFVFLMAGFLYGTKVFEIIIQNLTVWLEFKISKHAGLHEVSWRIRYLKYKI